MATLFWDASALTKRYVQEPGSSTVQTLFIDTTTLRIMATPWGYSETFASLLRKYNKGVIGAAAFTAATSALRTDVIDNLDFGLMTVDNADVVGSVLLIQRHNINSTDAALLATWLRYVQAQPPGECASCVLIASDLHLLRAAGAEGLTTLNPEAFPTADVPAFLTAL